MILAIGPTGVYLILAVAFLIVLGGGTYLAYYMNRRRAPGHAGDTGTGGQRGDGGVDP